MLGNWIHTWKEGRKEKGGRKKDGIREICKITLGTQKKKGLISSGSSKS